MCIICIGISSGDMSSYDVELALTELSSSLDPEHIEEILQKLNVLQQEEELDA